MVDNEDAPAAFARLDGAHHPRGARADHDNVECLHSRLPPMSKGVS